MADADTSFDDEAENDGGKKKKKKGLSGIVPKILKWVGIGIGAIILIVTVVIVTVSIMDKNKAPANTAAQTSPEYTKKREELSWYNSIGAIRTKTCDEIPASVQVDVVLGYKLDDKATSAEITKRQIEIKDFLRRYFSSKTVDELRPQNEEKLKIEIRNSINDDILVTSRIKDVRFMQFDVIEQ